MMEFSVSNNKNGEISIKEVISDPSKKVPLCHHSQESFLAALFFTLCVQVYPFTVLCSFRNEIRNQSGFDK